MTNGKFISTVFIAGIHCLVVQDLWQIICIVSSSDGKQYRVVCKEVEKVKGILEKKVHILV